MFGHVHPDEIAMRLDVTRFAEMSSDWDLMQIHVSALYRHDDRHRLLAVNEPGDPRPDDPHRRGSSSAVPVQGISGGSAMTSLNRRSSRWRPCSAPNRLWPISPSHHDASRRYRRCSSGTRRSPGPGVDPPGAFPTRSRHLEREVIPVTTANDDLVRPVFPVLADDLPWRQPCLAIVADGRLASLCYSARNTAIAAEAGVETVEEFRGRGYAPAVVAAWARAVRAEGRIPLYSTSWDNLASRSVARKLGLILYGADLSSSETASGTCYLKRSRSMAAPMPKIHLSLVPQKFNTFNTFNTFELYLEPKGRGATLRPSPRPTTEAVGASDEAYSRYHVSLEPTF